MAFQTVLGIDVSKEKLDLYLLRQSACSWKGTVENERKEIGKLLKRLQKEHGFSSKECLVVLEHTGLYIHNLVETAVQKKMPIWVEHSSRILMSSGLTRGKNDAIDAQRIAEYGYRFQEKAKLWKPVREVIQRLKYLNTQRDRLVKSRTVLQVPVAELEGFSKKGFEREMRRLNAPVIKALNAQIAEVEEKIRQLYGADEELSGQMQLIRSVPGVGEVTALALVIETNGFTRFENAKQLACHCGVAPFEHSSGKFKGRARVSPKANKRLKALLNLCARAAISANGEFREYYDRKLAEGKHAMSVLNAIRNKILLRVFAIVKRGIMYEKNYSYGLA